MNIDKKGLSEDNRFDPGNEIKLRGSTICPGIGIGQAHTLDIQFLIPRNEIHENQVQSEKQHYAEAVKIVTEHLHEHIEGAHAGSSLSSSLILKNHEAMLTDEQFHAAVLSRISTEYKNAAWALELEGEKIIAGLKASRSPYLMSRAEDIRDLVTSIVNALSPTPETYKKIFRQNSESEVCISDNLFPSSVMDARRFHSVAFATQSAALSSHAAILLKGFGIPAIGGLRGLRDSVKDGDIVIVDAVNAVVIIRPKPKTIQRYITLKHKLEIPEELPPSPPIYARTKDGVDIRLTANIDNPDQIQLVLRNQLEGVGLFRTEFFVLETETFPTEEEQYEIYRRLFSATGGRRVVIRTFDIGGDKKIPDLHYCTGENPALGVRGIRRHLLHRPSELQTQLRAILRAAVGFLGGILFPMITTLDDIQEIKRLFENVKEKLRRENKPFSEEIQIGAMIEIPAAAISISDILAEVDFVNIGTNDLLQYFVAADRDNNDVLRYENFENKAFLWLLEFIIERAAELGKEKNVTICGEGASHPELVPLLLRLGYRSLSITPTYAKLIRNAIANTDLRDSSSTRTKEKNMYSKQILI
ncbi:MAG: phosphoenolpyruvate--protein phosphotransferase [Thermodesulfobacteriota bacterium]